MTAPATCTEGPHQPPCPPAKVAGGAWSVLRQLAIARFAANMRCATGMPGLRRDNGASPDELIERSLGGMPNCAKLERLKRREAQRLLALERREELAALRRRLPQFGDPTHPHATHYREAQQRLLLDLQARAALDVIRRERTLVAAANAEMRTWQQRADAIIDAWRTHCG